MSGNNEWSIHQYTVQNHPLGFARQSYVLREGMGAYAPGFCDVCDDTMVLVQGNWDEGECAKCSRGGCSISWPMDAAQLLEGVAAAMFPRDYEAEEDPVEMFIGCTLPTAKAEEFIANLKSADVTMREAVLGALVMAGLVTL